MRIGVTGLARAGKTAFLTSVFANLMAAGAGLGALPALSARLAGRPLRVGVAASGTSDVPRFDGAAHLAAFAADPPDWPARTSEVSLLALDLEIGRTGLAQVLPAQRLRLELLDYPGEWLVDLPLLGQDFAAFSAAALRRLEGREEAAQFLAFAAALPRHAPADEALAAAGHALYRDALLALRERGLSLLQPGRFVQPAPGTPAEWMRFFPTTAGGPLATLLRQRYDRYREEVRRELSAPLFGQVDRLVVLADVLTALHAGPAAFADAAAALSTAAGALRWSRGPAVPDWLAPLQPLLDLLPEVLPFWGGIGRVAFAATKSDHVAEQQRGNLAALVAALVQPPDARPLGGVPSRAFAIASVRCTEDLVWTLDGRPVSAVRGRVAQDGRPARSYPGEVPATPPGPASAFWAHPFLSLPDFEPLALPARGTAGVPSLGMDALLAFLLDDVL